jgi:hypothetical protein
MLSNSFCVIFIGMKYNHKTFLNSHKEVLVVSLVILMYSLAVWLPTRNLPYYWDGAMTINKATRVIMERNYTPLIVEYTDFAHPPLFNLLHITAIKVFGDTLLAAHLLLFPLLPIYLGLTYIIARKTLNDTALAFAATILIATTPFVIAEYGQIYLDLLLGVLVLGAIVAQLHRRTSLAVMIFSFAVLTKLTALIILPMLIWLSWSQSKARAHRRKTWMYLISVGLTGAWLLYHHSYTGWWLLLPNRTTYQPENFSDLLNSLQTVLYALLVDQFRWLITLVAAFGLMKGYRYLKKEYLTLTLLLGAVLTVVFYTLVGELNYRYLLVAYPLAIVLGIRVLKPFSFKSSYVLIGAFVIALLFYSTWHPSMPLLSEYLIKPHEDLRYQDIIELGKQTADYIATNYPNANIYGTYPESYQLPESFQGYTQKPVAFNYCHYYQPQPNREVLIMHHKYSPLQPVCEQLLSQVPHELVQTFEQNGFWVNIYRVVN